MIDDVRDLTRGGGAGRIALTYVTLTGILGAALLLMKLVVALQGLGNAGSLDF